MPLNEFNYKSKKTLVSSLQASLPNIPWLEYINRFMKPYHTLNLNDSVYLNGLPYFRKVNELLKVTPKKVLSNCAHWLAIKEIIRREGIMDETSNEVQKQPRSKICMELITKNLPLAASALYVRKHFDQSKKKSVQRLFADLFHTFRNILKTVNL